MQCSVCNKSLLDLSKRVFTCEVTNLFWCKQCYENTDHEHKRTKYKGGQETLGTNEDSQRYLDNLFEDYHKLDCEDEIGGGAIKTRFGY